YMRLELIGTYGSTLEDFYDAAQMLNTGRVDVSKLVETHIPLDDIQKAFETASTPGNYRVSVTLD
ncbi:alcohol dehydrogenase, partial [Enterococcus sp. DIV1298c]|nr:alcohol dehydrogenase [Enterococcus sp. DIV1298c]